MKLISNPDLLKEDYRVTATFDLTNETEKIENRLRTIRDKSVYAVVGPYGAGKSTALYQIEQSSNDSAWVHFDAWKYPERQGLWEGFVLDVADTLGRLDRTVQFVDGKGRKTMAGDIADKLVTIASMIPALGSADKLSEIFEKSPATRVYQLQNILTEFFESFEQDKINIVVEDIDRSGDRGIFFLETLNYYLKNSTSTKRIIAIAPLSDESFYGESQSSYMKSVDYFDFFERPLYKAEGFVKELFSSEALESIPSSKQQLTALIEGSFRFVPAMDMRRLKVILRDFVSTFDLLVESGVNPDFRVCLAVTISKYIDANNQLTSNNSPSVYSSLRTAKKIHSSNSIIIKFLFSLTQDYPAFFSINHEGRVDYAGNPPSNMFIITRQGERGEEQYPSKPWVPQGRYSEDNYRVGICDYYVR